MKIDKAILASDDNPMYLDFWPLISRVWKERFDINPVLIYFGSESPTTEYGEVIRMKPLDDVPTWFQAQWGRIWYASLLGETVSIVSDIDMFPISKHFFVDRLQDIDDDIYISLYSGRDDYVPVCYNIASGYSFKEVLEIDKDFEKSVKYLLDAIQKDVYWGAEEEYLTKKVAGYKNRDKILFMSRQDHLPTKYRIDRLEWDYNPRNINDGYIDCHSVRPYKDHKKTIDSLVSNLLMTAYSSTAYSSHTHVLKKIIETFKINSVFEYGIGTYSTKLFLDKCDKVVSVEMNNHQHGSLGWYEYVVKELSNNPLADIWCHKKLVGLFPAIHYSMGRFENEKFDMIFVDGHGDTRGEQVNAALMGSDIIVAHDTEHREQRNKWNIPEGYEVIDFDRSPITTVITTNKKAEIIKSWDNICLDVSPYLI